MLHIEQVADNIESLTLERSSTSPLCIFFESKGSVNFTSCGEDILQWTAELEKSVPIFTSCPPATGALSGGRGWQQLCHALPPLQICCLRTTLCYNCQLASNVCRLLRSILEKCNIALCFICHLIVFSSSLPFRCIKIQGQEAPCVITYGTFVQFVQCISEKRSAHLGRDNSVL